MAKPAARKGFVDGTGVVEEKLGLDSLRCRASAAGAGGAGGAGIG